MTEELLSTDSIGKKKPGRKAQPSKEILALRAEVERLEACIAKLAHFSGAQRITDEFNVKRWEPGKKDMSRWKV